MKNILIIFAAATMALSIANYCYHRTPLRHRVDGAYDGCVECSQTAKDLAWSLDYEHSLWSADSFTIVRSDNSCLWYANGSGGLSAGKDSECQQWKPSAADKELLYRAFQRWAEKEIR